MTQYEADQAEIERRIADAVEAALKNTEGVRARLAESEKQVILCDEQIEAARREEREACAKVALLFVSQDNESDGDMIAAAIRARSTADGKQAEPVGPTALEEKP